MSFDIGFIDSLDVDAETGELVGVGRLRLGEFEEEFSVPLSFWSQSEYMTQWRAAIERVVQQRLPACLITALGPPGRRAMVGWWLLYPDGAIVHVQNHILLTGEGEAEFDEHSPFASIPEREVLSEDGTPVSEWYLPLEALEAFLHR